MKKLTLITCGLILLVATFAYGWGLMQAGGGVDAAGGTCDTAQDSATGAHSTTTVPGYSADYKYISSIFIADASFTACKMILQLQKDGSPTFDMDVAIFSDDASEQPNTIIGDWSDVVASSSVGTGAYESVTFENFSAALTLGTSYHLVIRAVTVGDSSNKILASNESGCGSAEEEVNRSSDGSSWTAYESTRCMLYELFSE